MDTPMLRWGANWLAAQKQEWDSVEIEYVREGTPLSIVAEVGRTLFTSNLVNAARVEWGDRDYLILVADLTFGEPVEGDRITEEINGDELTFEVVSPGGEPAWRYSDPHRTRYRVHCKQVVA